MQQYEVLKNLVKFNTIQDKENKEIIAYIESVLKEKGFITEYKDKALVMSNDPEAPLGFLGHTDTVAYTEGWNSDPLEMTIEEGKIYGLGVCDMKGGIAAMIDAVLATDFQQLSHGVKLFLTYDEEIGFGGIHDLIQQNISFPQTMLFGEPTDNEVLVGSKGLLELELNFAGIKAHASNPAKGKSANVNAIRTLHALDEFYETQIRKEKNEAYEIPYTTMNVGILQGGTGKNSIPENCFATLDFRTVQTEHSERILEKIDEYSKRYDFTYNIVERVEPFLNVISDIDSKKTSNFLTEASLLPGKDRIILGLGPVTAHEINEHITEESYATLVKQYQEMIQKFCK